MPTGREYLGPVPAGNAEQVRLQDLPLILGPTDAVPAGTRPGTLIARTGQASATYNGNAYVWMGPTQPTGTGNYVWYVTNADGTQLIDIRIGSN